jgi:hypothetical protein
MQINLFSKTPRSRMSTQATSADTPSTANRPISKAQCWFSMFCAITFVLNFLHISIPAHFVTPAWVHQIEARCHARPDLCLSVETEPHLIGWVWSGTAFYFTVPTGKTRELKALIVQDMPDSRWDRWLTPWNYVGAGFEELPPK